MNRYKATKEEVDYTPKAARHDERCELCTHFHPPKSCSEVQGTISPAGWCKRFKER